MKITLDIPNETVGAFFCYIYFEGDSFKMHTHSIGTSELFSGAYVKVGDGKEEAQE